MWRRISINTETGKSEERRAHLVASGRLLANDVLGDFDIAVEEESVSALIGAVQRGRRRT